MPRGIYNRAETKETKPDTPIVPVRPVPDGGHSHAESEGPSPLKVSAALTTLLADPAQTTDALRHQLAVLSLRQTEISRTITLVTLWLQHFETKEGHTNE